MTTRNLVNTDGDDGLSQDVDVSIAGGLAGASAIERGVNRLLASLAHAPLSQLPLPDGRRVDVFAVSAQGAMMIVEIKSSVADFRSDQKWHEYRAYCDRLYFAVDTLFPQEILPAQAGLIVADRYGAHIVRDAPVHLVAPARRKALMLRFARLGANRLLTLRDPESGNREF
jgi:hypothetical protein